MGAAALPSLLAAYEDKTAYAQCVFAFVGEVGEEPVTFDGRCPGRIVAARAEEGKEAFGWDPIFEPTEGRGGRTFAEMAEDEKNGLSHRGRALAMLKDWLRQNPQRLQQLTSAHA